MSRVSTNQFPVGNNNVAYNGHYNSVCICRIVDTPAARMHERHMARLGSSRPRRRLRALVCHYICDASLSLEPRRKDDASVLPPLHLEHWLMSSE